MQTGRKAQAHGLPRGSEKTMPAEACTLVVGECSGARPGGIGQGGRSGSLSSQGQMDGKNLSRVDDTELVREAQRGNRAAFEELVRHYDQAVLRLALHLTGSEQDAQDI